MRRVVLLGDSSSLLQGSMCGRMGAILQTISNRTSSSSAASEAEAVNDANPNPNSKNDTSSGGMVGEDRLSWIERAAVALGASHPPKRPGEEEEAHLSFSLLSASNRHPHGHIAEDDRSSSSSSSLPRCPPGFRVVYEEGSSMFTLISDPVPIPSSSSSSPRFQDTVFIRCDVSSCFKPMPLRGDEDGGRRGGVGGGVECPAQRQATYKDAVLNKEAGLRLKVSRIKRQEQRRVMMEGVEARRALESNTGLVDDRLRRIADKIAADKQHQLHGVSGERLTGRGVQRDPRSGKLRLICSTRYSDPAAPAPSPIPLPSSSSSSSASVVQEISKAAVHQSLLNRYKRALATEKVAVDEGLEEVPVRFRVGVVVGRVDGEVGGGGPSSISKSDEQSLQELFGADNDTTKTTQSPSDSSSSRPRPPLTGLSLHACCSTVAPAGCLRVDSVSFLKDPALLLEPTDVDKHSQNSHLYQGPRLHQGHLSDSLCGDHDRQLNPLGTSPFNALTKAGHSLDRSPTGSKHYFRPDVLPSNSIYEKFGHWPVHTVSPALNTALVNSLRGRGVDDALAAFVHQYAQHVYLREKVLWRRKVMGVLRANNKSSTW